MEKTIEERFNAAVLAAQGTGGSVGVYPNYDSCCRSCAFYELEQDHAHPFAFFFKQQGHEIRFIDGIPHNVEEMWNDDFEDFDEDEEDVALSEYFRRATHTYWYFNELEAGKAVADAFRAEGFEVVWDGTEGAAVKVLF